MVVVVILYSKFSVSKLYLQNLHINAFAFIVSAGETVWNNSLHVFFKEKYRVTREDIDIIFSVKDHLPTLEISVEKDGKIIYEN